MKSNQITNTKLKKIKVDTFHKDLIPVALGEQKMKNKWRFIFDNQWDFYSWWEFSVELFGLNIQKDHLCIVLFGFAFTWEK